MKDFPSRVAVELTNICNLSCEMCPGRHITMKKGYMDRWLFYKICAELAVHDIESVMLFWRGESLMHPAFNEFVTVAGDYRFPLILATNGNLIEKFDWLSLNKFKAINVSIHNKKSLEGLQSLLSMGLKPRIQASYVEGEDNGVDPSELSIADEVRVYKKHTINGKWGKVADPPTGRCSCPRLETDLAITWDGKISRCCYVWETISGLDVSLMTIKGIWNSHEFQLIKGSPDLICQECDQWAGGGKTL